MTADASSNGDAKPGVRELGAPQGLLVSHAILVGLTPLIPVPIVDGLVKLAIERRLVVAIANARAVQLDGEALRELAGERKNALLGIVKSIVKYPLRTMLRKVFFVLQVKRVSDEASLAYHRAFLVDRAIARGLLAPAGVYGAAAVRTAIESACDVVPISPLASALRGAFDASRAGLSAIGRRLFGLATRRQGALSDAEVADTVGAAEGSDVLERARAAVLSVPREHFVALERAFDDALARGR